MKKMTVNLKLSKKYAAAVDSLPRQCFRNSALVATVIGDGALYCEGYAIIARLGVPIEHAWVVYEGEIIDVTWQEADVHYRATRCYTGEEVEARVEAGYSQPYCIFADKMMGEHHNSLLRLMGKE